MGTTRKIAATPEAIRSDQKRLLSPESLSQCLHRWEDPLGQLGAVQRDDDTTVHLVPQSFRRAQLANYALPGTGEISFTPKAPLTGKQ